MKKLISNTNNGFFYALVAILLSVSCDKDDDIQETSDNPDNPQMQIVDPNEVTASLIFDNMNVVSGTPPVSKNNSKETIDLKIDSDTIFWTPGIIKRIKIQKPLGVSLNNGVWVYVPGADSYIETTLREEEESDEVGILYFDFMHSDWNTLDITFPLEIIPLDENGNRADIFKIPVVIEEPFGNNGNGGGACNIDLEGAYWEWAYYKQDNPQFFTGLWFPHLELSTTNGCCIGGVSVPNVACPVSDLKPLDYEILFMRPSLFMFFSGGKVNVFGELSSTNLDPIASNFCTNSAGYSTSIVNVLKTGDYIINSDCSISFDNFVYEGDSFLVDPTLYIGGGSQIKYTIISNHFMEQTISSSGGVDGGGSSESVASVFEKRQELIGENSWFD